MPLKIAVVVGSGFIGLEMAELMPRVDTFGVLLQCLFDRFGSVFP